MEQDRNAFKKNLGERIDSSYKQELRGIKEDVSFEPEFVVGVLRTGGIGIPLDLTSNLSPLPSPTSGPEHRASAVISTESTDFTEEGEKHRSTERMSFQL